MKAFCPAALLAMALAGCTGPAGPLLGEWRGEMPGRDLNAPTAIDLTLTGTPNAATGHYTISGLTADPALTTGHDQQDWGGTWVRSQREVAGKPTTIFALKDNLPEFISAYALQPDGKLRPLDPDGQVDQSPAGTLDVLSPVPPR